MKVKNFAIEMLQKVNGLSPLSLKQGFRTGFLQRGREETRGVVTEVSAFGIKEQVPLRTAEVKSMDRVAREIVEKVSEFSLESFGRRSPALANASRRYW